GDGIRHRGRAPQEAHQALDCDAHAATVLLVVLPVVAAGASRDRGRRGGGIWPFRVWSAHARFGRRPGGAVRFGFPLFQRTGAAYRFPRPDHRSGFGPDEYGDDADVDRLRRVLLVRAVSRRAPAGDPCAPPDRRDRRAASEHAARRRPRPTGPPNGGVGHLADRVLRAGAEAVPLAVGAGKRAGRARIRGVGPFGPR